ncbi:MAG TPA: TolC family protein [Terriglobales bacterium]|jgi:outer membrane protein TolC|nr:TolC family protein [Terriglobales bacterium]
MLFARLGYIGCGVVLLFAGIASAQIDAQVTSPETAPVVLTFQDAIVRARKNLPQFLSVKTDAGLAHEDKVQARAALLPSVSYTSQFLYTQPNGTPSGVFIANNSVHEYVSQGHAHEAINLGGGEVHDLRRTRAAEIAARAKLEVASRGLVVTVAQNFYGLAVAQRKYATAQTASKEAERFLKISRDLENGGEVAHSDAIKAQLQFNERQRGLREAQLAMENARLALAVILFPNFQQNFTVADDFELAPALPSFEEVQTLAGKSNPELAAATATLAAADAEVWAARSAHFPSLSVDYWYGIDADRFATRSADGIHNLGYAAAATLEIPIWSWGATQSKVKQAELNRDRTKVEAGFTRRQLIANLQSFYHEAATSRAQLGLLQQSFDLASESLRLTTLRYQAGEATVLEVVDAQNTLTQTHDAYDDAQARYRVALAELQTLTGTF